MGCLINSVGIDKNCSPETPSSGLFINRHLEGISLHYLDASAGEEYSNGEAMLVDIKEIAEEELFKDVQAFLGDKIRTTTLIDFDSLGYFKDNLQTVASEAGKKKGIKVEIDRSAYTEIHIHSVSLWLDDAVTTNVEVWDLISATKLDDISVTTVADTPTEVTVDKTYKTNKQKLHLAFIYDSGVAGAYETDLGGLHCCGKGTIYSHKFLNAQGVSIPDASVKIANNFSGANNTAGLTINYSVRCSSDNFVCYNSNSFALPYLFKIAEHIVRRAVFEPKRWNTIVKINKELNKDLEEDYAKKYEKSMRKVLENAEVPRGDACFECRPAIRRHIEIPG